MKTSDQQTGYEWMLSECGGNANAFVHRECFGFYGPLHGYEPAITLLAGLAVLFVAWMIARRLKAKS